MEKTMNIYEIADRLIDIEYTLSNEDDKLVLRNASNMLLKIENYFNSEIFYEIDETEWIIKSITDIIYPLDKVEKI